MVDEEGRKYVISDHPFSTLKEGDVFEYYYNSSISNARNSGTKEKFIGHCIGIDEEDCIVIDDLISLSGDVNNTSSRNMDFDLRLYEGDQERVEENLKSFTSIKVIDFIKTPRMVLVEKYPEYGI